MPQKPNDGWISFDDVQPAPTSKASDGWISFDDVAPATSGYGEPPSVGDEESRFRGWYRDRAARWGLDLNPDNPLHLYDYRAAFRAGAEPDPRDGHWPSEFKHDDHPNRFVGGIDTKTGRRPGLPASVGQRTGDISLDGPAPRPEKPARAPIPSFDGASSTNVVPPRTTDIELPKRAKGQGWLGPLPRKDGGVSTEISIGVTIDGEEWEIPTLVPTLDYKERQWLVNNDISDPKKIPQPIVDKATEFARQRIKNGLSPFNDPTPRAPLTTAESVVKGWNQTQQLGYGAAEATGELIGSEALAGFGKKGRQHSGQEMEGFESGAEFTSIQSPDDLMQWAKETFGSQIPIMAGPMAGAAAGATIGSIVPGVGTTIGGLIGAFVPSAVLGIGEVQTGIKERGEDKSAPGMAFLGGSAIGALDAALPGKIGSGLVMKFGLEAAEKIATTALMKQMRSGMLARAANGTIGGILTEGFTEALQEAIGEVAVAHGTNTPIDPQLGKRMINVGAAGALMGGAAGVVESVPMGKKTMPSMADALNVMADTRAQEGYAAQTPPGSAPSSGGPFVATNRNEPPPPAAPQAPAPPPQGPPPGYSPMAPDVGLWAQQAELLRRGYQINQILDMTDEERASVLSIPGLHVWKPYERPAEDRRDPPVAPPTEATPPPSPPPSAPPNGNGGGVPFVITRDMASRLGRLGYSQQQINSMSPAKAWDILGDVPAQEAAPAEEPTPASEAPAPVAPVVDPAQEAARAVNGFLGMTQFGMDRAELAELIASELEDDPAMVQRAIDTLRKNMGPIKASPSSVISLLEQWQAERAPKAPEGAATTEPTTSETEEQRKKRERAERIAKRLAEESAPTVTPVDAQDPTKAFEKVRDDGIKRLNEKTDEEIATAVAEVELDDDTRDTIDYMREGFDRFEDAHRRADQKDMRTEREELNALARAVQTKLMELPQGAPMPAPLLKLLEKFSGGFADEDFVFEPRVFDRIRNDRLREAGQRSIFDAPTKTAKPPVTSKPVMTTPVGVAKPAAVSKPAPKTLTPEEQAKHAQLRAELEEKKKKLKAALKSSASGSTAGAGIPAELIEAAIDIVETYAKMGILQAQVAYRQFKEDFADSWGPQMKRLFELAWEEVQNETVTVSDEEESTDAAADNEEQSGDDRGAAAADGDTTGGPGATDEGSLGAVSTDADEGAPGAGTGGARPGDPKGVLEDGVPDVGDAGEEQGSQPEHGSGTRPGGTLSPTGATRDPGNRPPDYQLTDERIQAVIDRPPMERVRGNVLAIRIAKKLLSEKRFATPEEQEALAMWVGWGDIEMAKFLESEPRDGFSNPQIQLWQELRDLLSPAELKSLQASSTNAHFTYDLYQPIWNALEAAGFAGGKVLEPAVGAGHAFGFMPAQMRLNSTLNGVEMETVTAQIAAALYPSARIQPLPYQEARIARNTQDVIISNVPFSSAGVTDPQLKPFLTENLHNYFFAKAMEQVRPGGFVVFVTSRFTMDGPESARVRRYLMSKAHFVGAVRLPNVAFKGTARTEVVTDLIILQRLMPGEQAKNAKEFIDSPLNENWSKPEIDNGKRRPKTPAKNVYTSAWYAAHPEYILGEESMQGKMYGKGKNREEYTVGGDRENLTEAIEEKLREILPPGAYEPAASMEETPEQAEGRFKVGELREGPRDTIESVNTHGELVDATPMRKGAVDVNGVQRVIGMIGVRDQLRKVIAAMQNRESTDEAVAESQAELKKLYDAFVKKHGYLNARVNKLLFDGDPESANVLALELTKASITEHTDKSGDKSIRVVQKVVGLADIFTKRTINPNIEITSVDTPKDALLASMGKRGRLDWNYMARVYAAGKGEDLNPDIGDLSQAQAELTVAELEDLIRDTRDAWVTRLQNELKTEGLVYEQPDGSYVTSDEYLSGDVVSKLADAEAALEQDGDNFKANVEALKAVQPLPKTAQQIKFSLGSHWIGPRYLSAFMADRLGVSEAGVQISTLNTESLVRWSIKPGAAAADNARRDTLTVIYGPHKEFYHTVLDILHDALNLKFDRSLGWYERASDGSKFWVPAPEATEAARANIRELAFQFETWIAGEAEIQKELVDTYNERYNRVIPRKYDGSHLLNIKDWNAEAKTGERTAALPGLALRNPLYKHQLNAVWRILTSGNTLLAHEVGAGKTYEMIVAAMEMRRTGRARKPMITVPTYLLSQWRAAILEAYPNAKVAAFENTDLIGGKREKAMARIAYGDWDIVLIPHSSFELMGVSHEKAIAVLQEWVNELMDAEAKVRTEDGEDHPNIKKLAARRATLQEKIDKRRAKIEEKKDDNIVWEQLGVDALFVDEAHAFKNLFFFSNINNLRGLSRSASDRALDMYLKIQGINEDSDYRNLVLATATPVMNSMAEVFTMQRYLQPQRLRELGFASFDSWYSTFAEADLQVESQPDASYREVTRLVRFKNLRLLHGVVSEVMDYISWDDMPYLKLPKVKGGKPVVIEGQPHPIMDRFMEWFSERLGNIAEHPPRYDKDQDVYMAPERMHPFTNEPMRKPDNILTVMGDARLSAIDPRLVLGNEVDDFEGSRVQQGSQLIKDIWKREKAKKGVILAFLDAGTPQTKNSLEFLGDVAIEDTDEATGVEDSDIEEDDEAEQGFIPDDQTSGFNMYEAVKKNLIARGIPSDQIAFIHDAVKPAERLALFEAVNEGRVRVLIASTDKGGVGMNVQKRMAALVHFDAPRYPRPGDIRQREGRIIRQGNEYYDEIEIYRFVTKGSSDENIYDVIGVKENLIDSFMHGDVDFIEDDSEPSSVEEARARATRDQRVVRLVKLKASLKRLQGQATAAMSLLGRAKQDLGVAIGEKLGLQRAYDRLKTYILDRRRLKLRQTTDERLTRSRKGKPPIKKSDFVMKVGKNTFTKRSEANEALVKAMAQVLETHNEHGAIVGEFEGLDLHAVKPRWSESVRLYFGDKTEDNFVTSIAAPEKESDTFGEGRNVIGSLQATLERLLAAPADYEKRLQRVGEKIAQSQAVIDRGLPEAVQKAEAARAEIREIELVLKAEGKGKDEEQKKRARVPQAVRIITIPGKKARKAAKDAAKKEAAKRRVGGEAMASEVEGMPALPGQPAGAMPFPQRTGGPPVTPRAELRQGNIIKALQAVFGTPTRYGRMAMSPGAEGFFRIDPNQKSKPTNIRAIRLRRFGDIRVALHEYGHDLDISLLKIDRHDKRWKAELLALGKNTSQASYALEKQLKEGAAEFFALFIADPVAAQQNAPNYYAEMTRVLAQPAFATLAQGVYQIQALMDEHRGLTPEQVARLAINRDDRSPLRKRLAQTFDSFGSVRNALRDLASRTVDEQAWIREAVEDMERSQGEVVDMSRSAWDLSDLAKSSGAKAQAFMEHGVYGVNGEKLSDSLASALRRVKGRTAPWEDYMVALRMRELYARHSTSKQAHLPAHFGMTEQGANDIIETTKAREDFADLQKARDGYWQFKDAVLEYARQLGAYTADEIAVMRDMNRAYIPLKRVMDDVNELLFGQMSGGGTARRIADRLDPVKRIGMSSREIVRPLVSVVGDTVAIIDHAMKNAAAIAFVDQAESSYGAGKWATREPTPKLPTSFSLRRLKKEIEQSLRPYFAFAAEQGFQPEKSIDEMLNRMVTVFTPAMFNPAKGEHYITVQRKGRREFWQINHESLYKALTAIGPRDVGLIRTFAQQVTNVLRTTATSTIKFVQRNLIRDSLVALLQSRYGFIPVYDHFSYLIDHYYGNEDLKLFWASGIAQATLVGSTRGQRSDYVQKLAGERDLRYTLTHPAAVLRALYGVLQAISQHAEHSTRYGEFKLALNNAGVEQTLLQRLSGQHAFDREEFLSAETLVRASRAARDVTTNFQKGGSAVKGYSRFKAFANARVQGWVRMGETLSGALGDMPIIQMEKSTAPFSFRVKSNHANFTGKGADLLFKLGLMSMFSAVLYFMNRDDDEWKEKPEYEKSAYWFIKLPGMDFYVKIAKPFEWGDAANFTEAALRYMDTKDPDRFKDMANAYYPGWDDKNALLRQVLNLSPTVAVPAAEALVNYDAFRDAPLWNPYDRGGRSQQFGRYTSETAKLLQRTLLSKLNPAQIDHLITGYTSNFGEAVLQVTDSAISGGPKSAPTRPLSQNPLWGAFLDDGDFTGQADSIQDLYKLAAAIEVAESESDFVSGKLSTTVGELTRGDADRIKGIKNQFGDIQKEVRKIYDNRGMSPEAKRAALNRQYARMVKIARQALKKK